MTLVLELTAEEEARLHAKAVRAGLDEKAYLRTLISDPAPSSAQLNDAEWEELLDEVGSEVEPSTPWLSDDAVSRASFYDERA